MNPSIHKILGTILVLMLSINVFSQNIISNPSFELGSTPNILMWTNQLNFYCTDWVNGENGCGGPPGTPDLFDPTATNCWIQVPANKASTTRFAHTLNRYIGLGGIHEIARGKLTQPLVPGCQYKISIWGSGGGPNRLEYGSPTCNVISSGTAPATATRIVEIYLTKSSAPCDPSQQILIHTSVNFTNNGSMPWMNSTGIFTATAAMAGYDRIEIRPKNNPSGLELYVLLDDISLAPNLPTITINASDLTPCTGQSVTLTASSSPGYTNYLWSNGMTTQTITVTTGGTYTVTAWNTGSVCQSTATVTINYLQSPVFNLGTDLVVCGNTPPPGPLIGSNLGTGYSYSWSVPPGFVAISPTVNANWPGTYCLTITDIFGGNAGCQTTDCINVTYTPPINATNSTVSACVGSSLVICPQMAPSIGTFTYNWGSGPVATPCTTVVVNSFTTSYPVTITDGFGCTVTVNVTVQPLPTPIIHILPYTPACAGDSVTLTAQVSGPYQAIWTDAGNNVIPGNPITVNPTTTQTYTVTSTNNSNGCSDTETITVVPLPGPTVSQTNFTVCQNGGLVNFFQESFFNIIFDTYSVNAISPLPPSALSIGGPGFTHKFNPAGLAPGDYTVEVCFNNVNGCCTPITFHVGPIPQLIIPDATPCKNDPPFFLNTGPLPFGTTVSYSGNLTGINTFTNTFNPATATLGANTFTICYNTFSTTCCSTFTITVLAAPNVTSIMNLTACETDPPIPIANKNWNAINFTSYGSLFSPGITLIGALTGTVGTFSTSSTGLNVPGTGVVSFDPQPSNVGANNIIYTVTSPNGCSDSAVGTITVCPVPVINLTASSLCNLPSTITATPGITPAGCPVTYSWTGPGGFTASSQNIIANTAGTYTVTATTSPGCSTVQSITIGQSPVITIALSDPQPCVGETVTLTANSSGAYVSYNWTNNSVSMTGNTSVQTATTSGTYCVTGTDINGCVSSVACTTLNFNSLPPVNIFGNDTICEGGDILLTVGLGGNCSSPSAQWLANNVPIAGATGPVLNIPNSTYSSGTIISVVFCCGGCCDTINAAVIADPVSITLDPVADIDLCGWNGNPVQLNGTSNGTNCVYSGIGIVDATLGLFDPVVAGGVGTYSVSYSCGLNGCADTATQIINVIESDNWHQTTKNAVLRDAGNDVITDAQGNVYITGFYTRQTTFDGGDNTDMTIVSGTGTPPFSFVAKYDDCANLMWVAYAVTNAAGQPNYGTSITLDEVNGLVYASGNFAGEIRYNGGIGDFASSTPGFQNAFGTNQRGYVACFNMNDGQIHFVNPIIIDDNTFASAITIHENTGKIYVGGNRNGAMNPGQDFMYVQRYSPTLAGIGTNDWQIDGMGDGSSFVNDMDFDENASVNGSLWFIGDFTIELLLGSTLKSTPAFKDAFVAKYDDGGSPSQAVYKQGNITGAGEMTGMGISANSSNGHAYVTGYTLNVAVADAFENLSQPIPNVSSFNAYFMALDAIGTNVWSVPNYAEAGTNTIQGKSASYRNGAVYFTGWFNGNSVFDGNPSPMNLVYSGTATFLHTFAVGYDAINGSSLWLNNTTDPLLNASFHSGNSIATDNAGHAFITGMYKGQMGYQAGIPASGILISSAGTATNAFTMRVDLNNNGEFRNEMIEEEIVSSAVEGLKLYPNPTNGQITLEIESYQETQICSVSVMGIDGKIIFQQSVNSQKSVLDISGLSRGIYFVTVQNGTTLSTIKVIKMD